MNINERLQDFALWVLLPTLETDDPNLQYYYDFQTALDEYRRAFDVLGCDWQWTSVTIDGVDEKLDFIAEHSSGRIPCVLNLCDGDELNGVPGISVVRALEQRGWAYTGAREFFYHVTTSKIDMKREFDAHHVPTAPWCRVHEATQADEVFAVCGCPAIIKPAVSGGSLGLTIRNVVSTADEYEACVAELRAGYRGWSFEEGGIIAESFISGREFTTFVVGTGDSAMVYAPVERVFHASLPHTQRFLSFDRLWETYDTETAMPNDESVYEYAQPDDGLYEPLMQLTKQAYDAVHGTGYGRLDIRQDGVSGALYVLEVNAQCGLSEDENYTSIGAILRFANESFATMTARVLEDALRIYEESRKSATVPEEHKV